jgi:cell pole-organizing protein PopZ
VEAPGGTGLRCLQSFAALTYLFQELRDDSQGWSAAFSDRKADDVESEMNQPAKAQEPSMEEILASIRRIISDDDAKPAAAPAEVAVAPAPSAPKPAAAKPATPPPPAPSPVAAPTPAPAAKNSQDDIDAMLASFDAPTPVSAPAAVEVEEAEDVFELTEQMAVPAAAADGFQKVEPHDDLEFTESTAPAAKTDEAPVLSGATAKAVESAFNSLATTVLSNNARTLEDLVKEMLRPMLKSWLDDNLPALVERIVKAEIERVARGR